MGLRSCSTCSDKNCCGSTVERTRDFEIDSAYLEPHQDCFNDPKNLEDKYEQVLRICGDPWITFHVNDYFG